MAFTRVPRISGPELPGNLPSHWYVIAVASHLRITGAVLKALTGRFQGAGRLCAGCLGSTRPVILPTPIVETARLERIPRRRPF
jgi:hypothetical protein